MATVFCPHCSDFVALEGHACSRCGVELPDTVRDEGVEPAAVSGSRLEFPTGSTFADRYTIVERIGAGGMGVVYKAIDTMLDDEVALKVIQPTLAEMPGYIKRFRREVRVTRQITHPNICRFHDIGEYQGILYVSMEWIEGETLRELLGKTGMLREGRALEIAEKIALALEAAHDKNIIHRDLKPANVMIDRRGNVLVLDFGLALERGADEITETGVAMGTPAYMSPEQTGLEVIGPQADLYALGLILREMLTGTRLDPVPGLTPAIRAAIDPLVVPVLESLLAERPEDRCPSAADARRMLRELLENPAISSVVSIKDKAPKRRSRLRLLYGAVGVVGVAAAIVLWLVLKPPPSELHPEAARFYDRGLLYLEEQGETKDGLGAAIVQLNRALEYEPDSARIWAALGRAHWLQYGLTRATVHREEAERAARRAYESEPSLPQVLNVRGLGFLQQGQYEAAVHELEESLEAEPGYGATWLLMGAARQARGEYVEALEAFRRAEELRPDSYAPQLYLGLYHQALGEYREAARFYEKATELKPDSARSWGNLGAAYLYTGRFEESVPLFERSLEIVESASTRSNLGTALYYLGRYEESVDHYRRAAALQPDHAIHRANLGDALFKLDRSEEARIAYRKAADVALVRAQREPLSPDVQNDLALYCAKAGDESCALVAARTAAELQPRSAKVAFNNAVVRCVLRLDGPCLEWLERAVKLGTTRSEIQAQPELERLADHPRFREILELVP
jgi:serine/threonine protein kinase/Flp pilus assembly protein TadD